MVSIPEKGIHLSGSLTRKLGISIAIACGFAFIVVMLAVVLYEANTFQPRVLRTLNTQAELLSGSLHASINFQDRKGADQVLQVLKSVPSMRAAAVFLPDGEVFARFTRDGGQRYHLPPLPRESRIYSADDRLMFVHPIHYEGEVLGHLFFDYDLPPLLLRMPEYSFLVGFVALAIAVTAGVLALSLQRVVIAPVLELEETTRKVRDSSDYQIRVRKHADDEIGRLSEGFNDMLATIGAHITERKRLEEDLKSALTSAEQAKSAAELANAAKDQFLAVLSHELRTPLTPVLAAVQLMQRNETMSEQARAYLEIVQRNLQLEARLIDDLLDLTRIVRGKIELEQKPIDIVTVIERVVEICQPDIQARKIHFGLDVQRTEHLVSGDSSRLQQVLWNLLKNSIKFTPEGGCVGMRCYSENARIFVEVTDTGIGIEPEVLPRLFNAFEQGDRRVTRQFGGLGLGLAISKRLIEMHGGTISASSPGKSRGATFRISLPSLPGAGRVTSMDAGRQEITERTTTAQQILLVEDHGDTAVMIRALLESCGYEVKTSGDVQQALEALERDHFDLVISDLGLPGRSGLELMQEIRNQKRAVKGIALSGFGREADVQRSKEAGFTEHLTKPVDFDMLLEVVQREIGEDGVGEIVHTT